MQVIFESRDPEGAMMRETAVRSKGSSALGQSNLRFDS